MTCSPYGADRWLLVIGDVCGKGPRAAGVTALARHTLRAAAMLGQTPTEMLGTLHRALRRQPPGADLCTRRLVTRRRAAGEPARLTVTLAGHPPPLLIDARRQPHARSAARHAARRARPDRRDRGARRSCAPGETLLLYTDGLPEAGRSDRRLGERGLWSCAPRHPALTSRRCSRASSRPPCDTRRACFATTSRCWPCAFAKNLFQGLWPVVMAATASGSRNPWYGGRGPVGHHRQARGGPGCGRLGRRIGHGPRLRCCKARSTAPRSSPAMVVLDLQSASVHRLDRAARDPSLRDQCRERAQQFAVTRGSPQVQRLLDITGVSEHLQTPTA